MAMRWRDGWLISTDRTSTRNPNQRSALEYPPEPCAENNAMAWVGDAAVGPVDPLAKAGPPRSPLMGTQPQSWR